MAKFTGTTERIQPFVTHNGDWDTLLVRVGHHLWRNYKKTGKVSDWQACHLVWGVKEAYRAPIRKEREARQKASIAALRAARSSKTTSGGVHKTYE